MTGARKVTAPRGTTLRCKGWAQEAALRMLMNNLDPEVAERPRGPGGLRRHRQGGARLARLRRDRARTASDLGDDETLLVQSGKAVGVLQAPTPTRRACSSPTRTSCPHWATWEHFWELEKARPHDVRADDRGLVDLHRHAGHLAGHLRDLRVGGAGPLRRRRGLCAGKLVVSAAGLGGMGGAQPLAVTMNGGVFLGIDVDPTRIARRARTRYLDEQAPRSRRRARPLPEGRRPRGAPCRSGLAGNCAEVLPELVRRGIVPDLVTDQTSAHDPLAAMCPRASRWDRPNQLRKRRSGALSERGAPIDGRRSSGRCSICERTGAHVFDYGNNLRGQAILGRRGDWRFRSGYPRLRARLHPAALLRGQRAVPLGRALGRSRRHRASPTRRCWIYFPKTTHLKRWLQLAARAGAFQGLPARICWLGYGERARAAAGASTSWCARARSRRRIVIGRDHLDSGSVASPNRETEAMRDGIGRDQRLGLLERAGQLRRRRHLGQRASRRRRRHGLLAARGHGGRRRRHRGGGAAARARAHHRPGHGRVAPRRRGLRGGARFSDAHGPRIPSRTA